MPQFLTLEKVAPRPISSSSTRKGTTFVKPISSSSPSVKPVTFLPSTSGFPFGVLTWRSAPGAWQTSATGLPAARKDSISLIEFLIFREIPHRAMAARIEDGVVVFLSHAVEAQRLVELSFGVRVLLEPTRDVGLKAGVFALGIERRASALGRCKGDLGTDILEHVVRRSHLLQPEASLTAGVAELVVGG